jgi:hypothetical protein
LPHLPSGFTILKPLPCLIIRRKYLNDKITTKTLRNNVDNKFFEMSRVIIEAMEQLYTWAVNLPDFKDIEKDTE